MAASAVFDRNQRRRTRTAERDVLTAAAGLERFTITDVARAAGSTYHYCTAQRLLRVLFLEGHLRKVNVPRTRPVIYEWVEP